VQSGSVRRETLLIGFAVWTRYDALYGDQTKLCLKTVYALLHNIFYRILRLWVKPDVLPTPPSSLINRDIPLIYVLEVGGAADRSALRIICEQENLPLPNEAVSFGDIRESSRLVVLQQRRGTVFRRHRLVSSQRLARLVAAGLEHDQELQIVPVAVYWGKAPEKEASFWRLWFTENWQFAGRTRKLLSTLIHGRQTLLSFSEPLSFNTLRSSGESSDILQRKLGRILRVHFRQRRIASLGPDQSHRRMLVDHVLSDPGVRDTIALQASTSGKSVERFQAKARRYANEIAADVSYPTIRILDRLLTRLWNELYDGVELSGIDRLKNVADGREIVYVPCHRSHIDYLLLSYILFKQGFSLPHIAAGINLNLPVVGGLLRRGGAFFLRRSFSGKPLYASVFNAYLKEILQRGHALEYFVEGGRSRSGRLLPPKGGMLSMTVHAYLREPRTPVVFVPVYFGYERLLEGRAFTSELAGGKKQKETIFGLIKSLRTLREDYGHVYVNVGEVIDLDQLLSEHDSSWRDKSVDEQRPDWLQPVVTDLGNTIMRNINEAACVTPISLLSTAILSTPRGRISRNELIQQINLFHDLLKDAHANSPVVIPTIDATAVIDHGMQLTFIIEETDDIGSMVAIRSGQAAPLTYFRNNILHLLTLPSLIASVFTYQPTRDDDDVFKLVSLTHTFLQNELFSEPELTREQFDQCIGALVAAGMLTREGNAWRRAPAGSMEAVSLMRLAQVVTPALEREYLTAALLARAHDGSISLGELHTRCQMSAQRLASTTGRDAGDLYDKHLMSVFVDTLDTVGFIDRDKGQLTATAEMLTMETEVRLFISERIRHAILNAALAVTEARAESPGSDP